MSQYIVQGIFVVAGILSLLAAVFDPAISTSRTISVWKPLDMDCFSAVFFLADVRAELFFFAEVLRFCCRFLWRIRRCHLKATPFVRQNC